MAKKKWKNPFYTLLIPVGLVFVLTGFAYSYMSFQTVNAGADGSVVHADHALFQFLNRHGDMAMLVELAVLALLTVGAIATDDWWMDEEPRPPQRGDDGDGVASEQEGVAPRDG